ncbi:MAG: leishmanolysin-related zinc metalloendopeptidase [Gemmatimonadota bacterium]
MRVPFPWSRASGARGWRSGSGNLSGPRYAVAALVLLSACESPLPAPLAQVDSLDLHALVPGDSVRAGEPAVLEAKAFSGRDPLPGVPVAFHVVTGAAALDRDVETTDAFGRALLPWRAGPQSGPLRVEARAGEFSATWEGTVLPGPGRQLGLVVGGGQADTVGAILSDSLQVWVGDVFDNAAPGTWVVARTPDGGRIQPDSVRADADGHARFQWSLGPVAGEQSAELILAGADTVVVAASALSGRPHSVRVVAGDGQSREVAQPLGSPLVVDVVDVHGNPSSAQVTFRDEATGIQVEVPTDVQGQAQVAWTLGVSAGEQTVLVYAATTDTARFQLVGVPGPPRRLAVLSGQGQTGAPGAPLPQAPLVQVRDDWDNGIPSVTVTFTVAEGGGSVQHTSDPSDADGRASPGIWTLGAPGPQRLQAQVSGVGAVVELTATAVASTPGFQIDTRVLGGFSGAELASLSAARDRWQGVVVGDLPDVSFIGPGSLPAGACGVNHPALQEVVDDLVVFVEAAAIDGPGGSVANAGVCRVRAGTLIPAVGVLRIDAADLGTLAALGLLGAVFEHELAHTLGVGVFWSAAGLLQGGGGPDPRFLGSAAGVAWAAHGGGGLPPVENVGGPSVRDVHWREAVLGTELMTSVLSTGANPLSAITVGSLADLGYSVNAGAADPLSLSASSPSVGFTDALLPLLPLAVGADGRPQGVPPTMKR